MKVEVLLFGVLAEKVGKDMIHVKDAVDLDSLRSSVFDTYPALRDYSFQISINRKLAKGNENLSEGDEIALLPPFAGG